jgi:hypothetical protein
MWFHANFLSMGVQANFSTVAGDGSVRGINLQSVPGENPTKYAYSGKGIGFDIGGSESSVWGYGNGPWTGLFKAVNLSIGVFAISIFWTPGYFTSGPEGWAGVTYGMSAGPPLGASYTETNYTAVRDIQ